MRDRFCPGLLFVACIVMAGLHGAPAMADEDFDDAPPEARAPARSGIEYKPHIDGVKDAELRDRIEAASQLFALEDHPPATIAGLERRTQEDIGRLQAVLRSEGYYAASVKYALDPAKQPIPVRVHVDAGRRYRLDAFEIRYAGEVEPDPSHRPSLKDIGIEIGMPARGPAIKAAEGHVLSILGDRGYPFPKIRDVKAKVRHDTARMTVALVVESGPRARFGALSVTGLGDVEADYVRRLVAWSEDDVYDRSKLDATRDALRSTGLFSGIRITTASATDDDGRLPMTIELTERPHRTIGVGVSYSTDIGLGGELFWEHRNLFGRNEQLKLTASGTGLEQTGKAEFRKPLFFARNQSLLVETNGANRDTDAFAQRNGVGTIALERTYPSRWRAVLGVLGEYDWIDDNEGEREFYLGGLQVRASRRTTDNALNPTRGTTLELSATPYAGTGDETLRFARFIAGGSAYRALDSGKRVVIAGRLRTGSIVGESTRTLPADKRFYGGGGGSVRGYEFQKVGPLDDLGDPIGGRSLLEASAELRVRVTDSFGVVPFVDGGAVFDAPYPGFDETIRWAAGLGLRYFTDFGPLRVDVAFPINGRDGVDDRFELYISIGQAF